MTRSSLVAAGAAVILGVVALGAAQSVAAAGDPKVVSFRNSRPSLPDDIYRAQLKAAKALGCQAALPPGFKLPPGVKLPPGINLPGLYAGAGGKVAFSTALATAGRVAGLRGARRRKLRKTPLALTPVGAERLAAAGLMGGSDKGALAALLVAADRNPRDPLLLINAAALLIDAGKSNEALALLARAQTLPQRKLRPFGVPTLGVLETNRAAALFRTGQYAAAAAAGKRALRKSVWLVEARENRGMALLCMNKETEAICEFREAAKRPLEPEEEHLTCAARVAKPGDFGFTVATPGVYPPIGYPALPSKAQGFVDYYQRLNTESSARTGKANDEYQRLTVKLQTPDPKRLPTSRSRASDLVIEMLKVPLRPTFVAQMDQGQALRTAISTLAADTGAEMHRIQTICGADEVCVHDRCNTLLQQNHPVWLARQAELERVMRAWWRDLHSEMQSYAQGIGGDDEHAQAVTQIDLQGLIGWDLIVDGAGAWNGVPTFLKPACLDPLPEPPVADPTVGPDGSPLNPCPPSMDKFKAKFDVASGKVESGPFKGASVGAGIEVKCSEVSVRTGADWSPLPLLSGFGKMNYASTPQGGTLTIGIGSKGGTGQAFFESGLQLTLSKHHGGTNVDLAWKVGPSVGPVKGIVATSDIVEISIFKSVAPPQASPNFPSQ